MQKTEICLVRHGETPWNKETRLQGSQDIALSPLGILQAKTVAERLRNESWHAIYSSDLTRAYDTAKYIRSAVGLSIPHHVDKRLRERHYGTLEGMTRAEILQLYPDFHLPDDEVVIPGVETHADLRQRVYQAIHEVATLHRGKRIIIVSHGGSIHAFLYKITGRLPERIGNTAITRITWEDGKWYTHSINDTSHLENMEIPSTQRDR
ncbi:phosphoglycerate mutase [Collibacillus ludicampi]|jgi:broad specificity phosphatase PhoE|uniref:Phosphoglycerate mutase n=1 Tax=Collibacillus ludicampi TaxID=2771369 RepID=A0AAV4L9U3_9BACL|nr:histidine phosphatase family protein [Collibacillus ludicampi]GIM44572.1 phosphoglycerate mutase [Collibacillus ludicampi]